MRLRLGRDDRKNMTQNTIRISEIFGPTIQGEGVLIGQPTVFVRTGGCDFRCSWCDSLHAVESKYRHDWTPMNVQEIMAAVKKISGGVPLIISLSGGNPATQDLSDLIKSGKAEGYSFALETQGSIAQDWFSDLDILTLSPKPPSSDMEMNWNIFEDCITAAGEVCKTALKMPLLDEADYLWAKEVAARYETLPLYLQPVNHTPPGGDDTDAPLDLDGIATRYEWLMHRCFEDHWYRPVILPQLHVMLWGNKRGV
jgi:7-carboxy-7-deazaguanine synthase